MLRCEVCGKNADKHHIIHRCEGGLDYPLNIKLLCPEHHRGHLGPHRNKIVDLEYKLELQKNLEELLCKEYYSMEKLSSVLDLKPRALKKLLRDYRLYKEGYKREDILYELMGHLHYDDIMLEHYHDFIPIFNYAQ